MLVSILISNYNYGKYLEYCLQSVLSQTYDNIEIIVYDDGSTDNSLEILRRYKGQITVIANPNFGKSPCFNQINAVNETFAASQGEIICLLDSDDAFTPNKIAEVVKTFQQDQKIILVQHRVEEIDSANNHVSILNNEIFQNIDHFKAVYFTQRLDYFYMMTSALSFRRTYLEQVMPIPVDQYDKVVLDIRLTRPTIFYGQISCIDRALSQYRLHRTSYTGRTMSHAYLEDVTQQTYEYFNRIAHAKDYPQLNYSPGIIWKIRTTLKYLMYIVICSDTYRQKLSILWSFVKRRIYRMASLKKGLKYGARA